MDFKINHTYLIQFENSPEIRELQLINSSTEALKFRDKINYSTNGVINDFWIKIKAVRKAVFFEDLGQLLDSIALNYYNPQIDYDITNPVDIDYRNFHTVN